MMSRIKMTQQQVDGSLKLLKEGYDPLELAKTYGTVDIESGCYLISNSKERRLRERNPPL